jgi:hypothetical protein
MLDYSLGGIAIRPESGTPGGRDEATGGSVTGGTRDLDERAGGVLRPVLEPLRGSRGPRRPTGVHAARMGSARQGKSVRFVHFTCKKRTLSMMPGLYTNTR